MCRGDRYLSNQKHDCSSMFATRGPQLLAPSSSDAGQSQSQKTALHRQTLLKPKGNSTLIGAVWEFTLVKWRRRRCRQLTLSACKLLILLGSHFDVVRIPRADPRYFSEVLFLFIPWITRLSLARQFRRSSFHSPRGWLSHPDRLRRQRWRRGRPHTGAIAPHRPRNRRPGVAGQTPRRPRRLPRPVSPAAHPQDLPRRRPLSTGADMAPHPHQPPGGGRALFSDARSAGRCQ
jgi:hypothetical protein